MSAGAADVGSVDAGTGRPFGYELDEQNLADPLPTPGGADRPAIVPKLNFASLAVSAVTPINQPPVDEVKPPEPYNPRLDSSPVGEGPLPSSDRRARLVKQRSQVRLDPNADEPVEMTRPLSSWEHELEAELASAVALPQHCQMVDEKFELRQEFKDTHKDIQFVYAIQMKTFDPEFDDSSTAFAQWPKSKRKDFEEAARRKRHFNLVFNAIRDVLCGKPDPTTGEVPYGDGTVYLGWIAHGKYDPGHAYIQVGACLQQLEDLAESLKLQMPGLNENFHPFDTMLKADRTRFSHPQFRACPVLVDAYFAERRKRNPPLPQDTPDHVTLDTNVQEDRSIDNLMDRAADLTKRRQEFKDNYLRDIIERQIINGDEPKKILALPTATPAPSVRVQVEPVGQPPATTTTASSQPQAAQPNSSGLPDGFVLPKCTCNLFVPYQKEELVRTLIERALDNVLTIIDQEKSTAGNGLRELKRRKVLKDIFPLHYEVDRRFYSRSRKDVVRDFCSIRTCYTSAFSFLIKSRIFISWMRDYFGEKIGMYFAFLHFYNNFTLYLAILGLIPAIWQYAEDADNISVVIYCVVIMLWAAFFVKFWNRQSNDYAFEWDMLEYEQNEGEMDSFLRSLSNNEGSGNSSYGFYELEGRWVDMTDFATNAKAKDERMLRFIPKSHIDTSGKCHSCFTSWYGSPTHNGDMERAQLNADFWRYFKESLGWTVITTLIGCVLSAVVSLVLLKLVLVELLETYGQIVAGVANGIVIFVLDKIYRQAAVKMTEWENHRTATQFEEKLTSKCFVFQFVNSYFSLFYIAFFKSGFKNRSIFGYHDVCIDSDGDESENCMNELSSALMSIILTRFAIALITQRFLPKYLTKLSLARLRVKAQLSQQIKDGISFTSKIAKKTATATMKGVTGVAKIFDDDTNRTTKTTMMTLETIDEMKRDDTHGTTTNTIAIRKNQKLQPIDLGADAPDIGARIIPMKPTRPSPPPATIATHESRPNSRRASEKRPAEPSLSDRPSVDAPDHAIGPDDSTYQSVSRGSGSSRRHSRSGSARHTPIEAPRHTSHPPSPSRSRQTPTRASRTATPQPTEAKQHPFQVESPQNERTEEEEEENKYEPSDRSPSPAIAPPLPLSSPVSPPPSVAPPVEPSPTPAVPAVASPPAARPPSASATAPTLPSPTPAVPPAASTAPAHQPAKPGTPPPLPTPTPTAQPKLTPITPAAPNPPAAQATRAPATPPVQQASKPLTPLTAPNTAVLPSMSPVATPPAPAVTTSSIPPAKPAAHQRSVSSSSLGSLPSSLDVSPIDSPRDLTEPPPPPHSPPAVPAPIDDDDSSSSDDDEVVLSPLDAASPTTAASKKKTNVLFQAGGAVLDFTGDVFDVFDKIKFLGDMDKMSLEYQAIQPKYAINMNVLGTFDDYNELVIGYGYMVMFAAAFPICPAITLAHNIIQNSTHGFKLIKNYQKPKYYGATDIGMFWYLLVFLTAMSVGTNTAIICFTSTQLEGYMTDVTTTGRLAVAMVLEHIFGIAVYLVLANLSDFRPSLRVQLAFNEQVKDVETEYAEYIEMKNARAAMAAAEAEAKQLADGASSPSVAPPDNTKLLNRLRSIFRLKKGHDGTELKGEAQALLGRKMITGPPAQHQQRVIPPEDLEAYKEFIKQRAQKLLKTDDSATNTTPRDNWKGSTTEQKVPDAIPESDPKPTPAIEPIPVMTREPITAPAPPPAAPAPAPVPSPKPAADDSFDFDWDGVSLPNTSTKLRRVPMFDPVTRELKQVYTQQTSSADIFFPFVVDHLSELDGIVISDPIPIGRQMFRLVVGKRQESESIEFTLRYEEGPLPHFCSAYLVAKRHGVESIGLYRSLTYMFTSHTGFGFPRFASLSELRQFGCYKPKHDALTVGLVLPSTNWMGAFVSPRSPPLAVEPREEAARYQPPTSFPRLLSNEQPQPIVVDRPGSYHYRPPPEDPFSPSKIMPDRWTPTPGVLPPTHQNRPPTHAHAHAPALAAPPNRLPPMDDQPTRRKGANLPPLTTGLRTPQHAVGGVASSRPSFGAIQPLSSTGSLGYPRTGVAVAAAAPSSRDSALPLTPNFHLQIPTSGTAPTAQQRTKPRQVADYSPYAPHAHDEPPRSSYGMVDDPFMRPPPRSSHGSAHVHPPASNRPSESSQPYGMTTPIGRKQTPQGYGRTNW